MLDIVYILIHSKQDFYYEQALLSIVSLRMHNEGCSVTVVTDCETFKILKEDNGGINELVDQFIAVDLAPELQQMQRSRFLKTNLMNYVKGDFVYIDTDTIITGSLDGLNDFDGNIGAVYAQHNHRLRSHHMHFQLKKYSSVTNKDNDIDHHISQHFNSGVIVVKDTKESKAFFETWHRLWLHSSCDLNFHQEQPDMWRANYLHGNLIKSISGIYNFQAIYPNQSIFYLHNCKVLHYFCTAERLNKFKPKDHSFLMKIRQEGITDKTKIIIQNIIVEYLFNIEFLGNRQIMWNRLYFLSLCRKTLTIFPFLEKLSKFLYRMTGRS